MSSRIVELAMQILANTVEVDSYLTLNGLPQPSFEVDGPLDLGIKSREVEANRIAAIEASVELQELLLGPKMLIRPVYNATSLQAIYKYDIARKVPLMGEISFTELAKICEMYEPDLKRILRFAICYYRVFQEQRKGYVSHSAASRCIAEDQGVRDALGVMFDDCWQSFARTVEAMDKFKSQELNETGFSLAHNINVSFYQYLNTNPEKSRRFAGAMKAFEDGPDISPSYLVASYPWASLGAGTVVDVGGSQGSISVAISEAHPVLKFIVQDRPEVIEEATQHVLPIHVADRIEFMAHDFFTEQPIRADMYLFRYIFHNWPDTYVIKILRQLVPALRPGARVLINDNLLPEPNTASLTMEREVRAMDMVMLTLCNARERDRDDWEMIFQQADDRFGFVGAYVPDGSSLGIIEARWEC